MPLIPGIAEDPSQAVLQLGTIELPGSWQFLLPLLLSYLSLQVVLGRCWLRGLSHAQCEDLQAACTVADRHIDVDHQMRCCSSKCFQKSAMEEPPVPPGHWDCPSSQCDFSCPPTVGAGGLDKAHEAASRALYAHLTSSPCLKEAGFPSLAAFKKVDVSYNCSIMLHHVSLSTARHRRTG